ncbi:SMC-Scp complex subunit ScpB [Sediminibacterium roseum]|uniref:SMC-Scp complex subunit ScpB n=1 Tax=Sediminibacterium roseum TaxID=1978412 RepID=A0ABW9ZWR1_9BACT|nr:SMC-Scp complex subunit ScpB [Sediminibacterium roseum]NCI51459.1 SMC-Scp complex subunit ScpB [Sediminibacterium roseum]
MEISQIIPHIEVLIFASEKPLTSLDIVELINNTFGFLEERVMPDQVESALEGIREKYSSEFYPFEVKESGGGWQFLTKVAFHSTIAQLNGDKFLKRLSNAALETLAIIAYKQPITKGEIEAIRGVNSDYSIQKLLEKELVLISGRNENMPGKPLVYSTSKNFMDYFGINSAADLPKIQEVLAEQIVEGTIINPEDFTDQNVANTVSEDGVDAEVSELTVNEEGELIIKEQNENPEEQEGNEGSAADETETETGNGEEETGEEPQDNATGSEDNEQDEKNGDDKPE